jgi:hypothetical protein
MIVYLEEDFSLPPDEILGRLLNILPNLARLSSMLCRMKGSVLHSMTVASVR